MIALSAPLLVARIAWIDFIRRKDLYVVSACMMIFLIAILAIRIMGIPNAATALFLMNCGISLAHFLTAILAASFSARAFPEEFERGTIAPLLAKPLERYQVLIGKLAASASFAIAVFLLFAILTLVAVPLVPGQTLASLFQILLLQSLGLLLLSSASMALSLYAPTIVAALIAFLWYFSSGLLLNIIEKSAMAQFPGLLSPIQRLLPWLPDPGMLFHIEAFANAKGALPAQLFLCLLLYGAAWAMAFVLIANHKFSRIRL